MSVLVQYLKVARMSVLEQQAKRIEAMLELEEDLKRKEEERQKLARENSELKSLLHQVHSVVKGSLVTLDITIKLGACVGLWFFPLPQDRIVQVMAIASYAILVTITSKGIQHMKAIQEKI